MKCYIKSDRGFGEGAQTVWDGDLNCIPRVGDHMHVDDINRKQHYGVVKFVNWEVSPGAATYVSILIGRS
jgi:hypothetical protein